MDGWDAMDAKSLMTSSNLGALWSGKGDLYFPILEIAFRRGELAIIAEIVGTTPLQPKVRILGSTASWKRLGDLLAGDLMQVTAFCPLLPACE
jgi:hypothetical protein